MSVRDWAPALVRRACGGLFGLYLASACSSDRPEFGRISTEGEDAAIDASNSDTPDSDASVVQDAAVPDRDAAGTVAASTTESSTQATTISASIDSGINSSSDMASTSANSSGLETQGSSERDDSDAEVTGESDASTTNDADASTTDDQSSTDDPSESATNVSTTLAIDAGASTSDAGCRGNEDCDGSLLCAPNGECVECLMEGDIREGTTACGLNDAGLLQQECVAGFWVDGAECEDPDECENGTTTTCGARFSSLGVCESRVLTCANGAYNAAECGGEVELCNPDGLDEDCDGELNEAPCEIYTSLAAADGHVCALTSEERVLCWGSNSFGQTGSADADVGTIPTAVFGMTEVRSVAVANTSSCAVFHDDSARCWGSNDNGELGDGTTNSPGLGAIVVVDVVSGIRQMLPGRNRACAVLTDGTVECWGDDPDPTVTAQIGNLSNVVVADVAPEGGRFCGLIDGGSVRCWDTFDDSAVAISGVTDATQVGVGDAEACALLSDGTVSCWTATNAADVGLTSVVHVDSGRDSSCAVVEDGRVYCWGDFYGITPVPIEGISNATSVSVGYSYACVVKSDATASCFGKNLNGQLGDPNTECCSLDVIDTRFPPVLVAGP